MQHTNRPGAFEADAIREARATQTAAIASGDLDRVATYWTDDVTIRRALGQAVEGAAAARKIFATDGHGGAALIYQRRSVEIDVSETWPLAYEAGLWSGHLGSVATPEIIGGRYSAQWVRRDGRWLIRSEVFVALTCRADGCGLAAVP